MAQVTLRLDAKDAQRAIARLRQVAPQRIARAVNRAGVSARTLMTREIARDMALKQADVKPHLATRDARAESPTFTLEIKGARMPLIKFGARQTRRGVTANTGGGRKVYPGTFIATMRSGHTGVFQRVKGANRRGPKPHRSQLPIEEKHGASLPLVFEKHAPAALARGEEQLVKNLVHELKFAASQVA